MRRRADFAVTVRHGSRAGRRLLTAHLLVRATEESEPPRAGFVVGRSVGRAVVRNRVRRRLRALGRGYLPLLPGGSLLVVRAHAQAATARQADLAADLALAMDNVVRRQVRAPQ